MNPRDFLSGAVAGMTGTVVLVAVALSVRMLSGSTTPPPAMPTEPPALLIGVAADVDIHVFNDHENRNVCYITTNRLRIAAGGISCVPMAYRDLEDDDVPHR